MSKRSSIAWTKRIVSSANDFTLWKRRRRSATFSAAPLRTDRVLGAARRERSGCGQGCFARTVPAAGFFALADLPAVFLAVPFVEVVFLAADVVAAWPDLIGPRRGKA